ncbi:hypothetical protein KIL84_016115 [Mauremys mutica]|uniref:Interleukin-5 n=1 Tax=Mauremys mutica TaxID=74926 RepID=A0A9D3WTB6_9SAUR|nr:hypothetical protein KIL84_016115 [Mauremys mutica]
MITNVMKDDQRLKIPIPVHQNNADCASTILDGIDLLEKQPEMQKFSNIFRNLKEVKTSLQQNLKTQASCDTESVTVSKFIKKLEDFIRTRYRTTKH